MKPMWNYLIQWRREGKVLKFFRSADPKRAMQYKLEVTAQNASGKQKNYKGLTTKECLVNLEDDHTFWKDKVNAQ